MSCYLCPVKQYKNMQQRTSTREEYLKRVNLVIEYVNNHLGENIDLNRLAEISNFSPYHFHRVMSAFLGEPLGTFIVRTRIETAARLLRYTDLSISEIAYRVGYGAPSSLSKTFRQFYSISPNEYRNNKEYTIMRPEKIGQDLQLQTEVKDIPARDVIYIRLTGDYRLNDYGGIWKRLIGFVIENKLPMGDPSPLCIYYDDPKVTAPEKLRTDVCMVLPLSVEPKGEVGARQIPAGRYATFLYKGAYEHLGMVYDTIYAQKIPQLGYTFRDEPSYERYLNDPCNTLPEDLLTEICIPIE